MVHLLYSITVPQERKRERGKGKEGERERRRRGMVVTAWMYSL